MSEHGGKLRASFTYLGARCRENFELDATAANIKSAERTLKEIRQKIADGTFDYAVYFPNSKKVRTGATPKASGARGKTLAEAIASFLKTKESKSNNTKKLYRNAGEVWKVIFGADTPLSRMTPEHVETTVGSYPFASSKLKSDYLIVLRGALSLAHNTDQSWTNPLAGVKNDPRQRPQAQPVTGLEMAKILDYMLKTFDPRVHAYFVWQFETGMRPEEAIALQWGDIDWTEKTAHVCRARTLSVTGPCKTHEVRDVDLSDDAIKSLLVLKQYTFRARSPDNVIFQNPTIARQWNDPRSQHDMYWTPALKALGIRARRAYNTRHTFASLRLSVGAVPAYISKQLGHESLQQLYRTYGKWIGDNKPEAERVKALMAAAHAAAAAAAAKK